MYILAIDDEPGKMRTWWRALEQRGHRVFECVTTEEARRRFYVPGFSLIIVDRLMSAGNDFIGHEPDIETGSRLVHRLRTYKELRDIPVIVFTNLYERDAAESWQKEDERLIVRPKTMVPQDFSDTVEAWARQWPFESVVPTVPPDEYPNCAPYNIKHIDGKDRRVYFEPCRLSDKSKIAEVANWNTWKFGDLWADLLGNPDAVENVLKVVVDLPKPEVLGLYCSLATDEALWWQNVVFETLPVHQIGQASREYLGIGEACVARFLRECLYKNRSLGAYISMGTVSLTDKYAIIDGGRPGVDFLDHLGFTPGKTGRTSYDISERQARKVLDWVHYRVR